MQTEVVNRREPVHSGWSGGSMVSFDVNPDMNTWNYGGPLAMRLTAELLTYDDDVNRDDRMEFQPTPDVDILTWATRNFVLTSGRATDSTPSTINCKTEMGITTELVGMTPAKLQTAKALRNGQAGSNGLLQCSDYDMNDCTPERSDATDLADIDRPSVPSLTGGEPHPCDDALVPIYAPDVDPVYGPQCQLENTDA